MEFNTGDKVSVIDSSYLFLDTQHKNISGVVNTYPDAVFEVVRVCEYPIFVQGGSHTCVVIKPADKRAPRHFAAHVPAPALGPIIQPYTVDQWSID